VFFPKILKPGIKLKLISPDEINIYKINRDRQEIEFDDSLKLNMKIQKIKSSNDYDAILSKLKKQPDFKRGIEKLNKSLDKKPHENEKSHFSFNNTKKPNTYTSHNYEINKFLRSSIMQKEKLDLFIP